MSHRPLRLLSVLVLLLASGAALADQPNVLFIAVDDLRPDLGAYGEAHMVTPHMDRLAEEGRLFRRHYVQVPTCGASRYALLTGQYPARQPSWGNNAFALYRQGHAPPSLPQWFRDNGYRTVQMGKISHSPDGRNLTQNSGGGEGEGSPEIPDAWDTLSTPVGEWGTAWNAFFAYAGGQTRTPGESPPLEAAEVGDRGYPDGVMAEAAVAKLKTLRDGDQPFFFAVGFFKPHLPFNAPQKYWDLYDRDAIDISSVDPVRRRGGEFFGNYGHTAQEASDPDRVRKLRHGYWAATSYADAQVGKVLDALDELGLRENTIVVLWGDHGYHLGELGFWGKHTLHEHSMRSAFIVRTPGMAEAGTPTDALTGSVDIYPTLVELAGLPTPDHIDGRSFVPVLDDPQATISDHVLGFWRNGYTIRSEHHRLIRRGDGVQLFDHRNDPGETTDIANEHGEVVERLSADLEDHLARRKALPTE